MDKLIILIGLCLSIIAIIFGGILNYYEPCKTNGDYNSEYCTRNQISMGIMLVGFAIVVWGLVKLQKRSQFMGMKSFVILFGLFMFLAMGLGVIGIILTLASFSKDVPVSDLATDIVAGIFTFGLVGLFGFLAFHYYKKGVKLENKTKTTEQVARARKSTRNTFLLAVIAGVIVAAAGFAVSSFNLTCGLDDDFVSISGTEGDDVLTGTFKKDVIHGMGGNDIIHGMGGNDILCGGSGDDEIYGGDGNDFIDALEGNNILDGGSGNDKIYGAEGDDLILGGTGNDFLHGSKGDDVLKGGSGEDLIWGYVGDDVLEGGPGNDDLSDTDGNNILDGGKGNDACRGNEETKKSNCEAEYKSQLDEK